MNHKSISVIERIVNNDAKVTLLHAESFSTEIKNNLLKAIKENTCLRSLFIRIENESGAALADMLRFNQTLKNIDLADSHYTASTFKDICDSLKQNKSLRKIGLLRNNIGGIDQNAEQFSEVLKYNKAIKDVNLFSNDIACDGAKSIAEALKINTSLTTLELDRNPIGDSGVEQLAESLCVNKNLRKLHMVGCQIGSIGAKALAAALIKNNTLQVLEIWKNVISDEGVVVLAEH